MTRDAKRFLLAVGVILSLIACVSIIASLVGHGSAVGDNRDYEISGVVEYLEVEIGAADFRIEKGSEFSVKSNLKHLSFRQTGDRLVLRETMTFGNKNYNGAELVITIPEDLVLKEIDITTGAGRFTADIISAKKVSLELGAGEVIINQLIALNEADIEGGTGKITIGGGSLNNLRFEMGVGELNLCSRLSGNSDLELGIGEANVVLIGTRDDYMLDVNKGIGDISLEGESVSGGKIGSGDARVNISGGIGAINVNFK